MKVYPLYKTSYGDFDVARDTLVSVYYDVDEAQSKANELNSARTKEQRDECVSWSVGQKVPLS